MSGIFQHQAMQFPQALQVLSTLKIFIYDADADQSKSVF